MRLAFKEHTHFNIPGVGEKHRGVKCTRAMFPESGIACPICEAMKPMYDWFREHGIDDFDDRKPYLTGPNGNFYTNKKGHCNVIARTQVERVPVVYNGMTVYIPKVYVCGLPLKAVEWIEEKCSETTPDGTQWLIGDITHPDAGRDIVINVSGQAIRTRYETPQICEAGPIDHDPIVAQAIMASMHDIGAMFPFPDKAELDRTMALGAQCSAYIAQYTGAGRVYSVPPAAAPAPHAPAAPAPAPVYAAPAAPVAAAAPAHVPPAAAPIPVHQPVAAPAPVAVAAPVYTPPAAAPAAPPVYHTPAPAAPVTAAAPVYAQPAPVAAAAPVATWTPGTPLPVAGAAPAPVPMAPAAAVPWDPATTAPAAAPAPPMPATPMVAPPVHQPAAPPPVAVAPPMPSAVPGGVAPIPVSIGGMAPVATPLTPGQPACYGNHVPMQKKCLICPAELQCAEDPQSTSKTVDVRRQYHEAMGSAAA
jgi:hypothetical protein